MKLIPLSKTGKYKGKYFAQVDDEDYDYLIKLNCWVQHDRHTKYVICGILQSNGSYKKIRMHRLVMKLDDNKPNEKKIVVDHKDHNGLNNQKLNLRICSLQENQKNTSKKKGSHSKYLGVIKEGGRCGFAARIKLTNGIRKRLGYFKDEIDAARAYDAAAKIHHGEFANLNFKE
jgi:hypothetical protein